MDPVVDMLGFAGAGLSLSAWAMKRTLHMRMLSLASSLCLVSYGLAVGAWPVVVTNGGLLPLNAFRLWQLRRVLAAARGAVDAAGWLMPHARLADLADGAMLVEAGAPARRLVLILSGHAEGEGCERGPGDFAGDGRPFLLDATESRTMRARGPVTVAMVRLPALEDYALQDPLLMRRVAHLAFAPPGLPQAA